MNDISKTLTDARFQIAGALVSGGRSAALAALAAQSIRLHYHVIANGLRCEIVFRELLQAAINLRLVDEFGKRAVQTAIDAGLNFYGDVAEAA